MSDSSIFWDYHLLVQIYSHAIFLTSCSPSCVFNVDSSFLSYSSFKCLTFYFQEVYFIFKRNQAFSCIKSKLNEEKTEKGKKKRRGKAYFPNMMNKQMQNLSQKVPYFKTSNSRVLLLLFFCVFFVFFPLIVETTRKDWVKSRIMQYVICTETSSFLADLQNSVVDFYQI